MSGWRDLTVTWVSGPWWCSSCGRVYPSAAATEAEEPRCRCGSVLELEGTGDDDPYPEDAA